MSKDRVSMGDFLAPISQEKQQQQRPATAPRVPNVAQQATLVPPCRIRATKKGIVPCAVESRKHHKVVAFSNIEGDIGALLSALQKALGTGGIRKGNSVIEVQGKDHLETIRAFCLKSGCVVRATKQSKAEVEAAAAAKQKQKKKSAKDNNNSKASDPVIISAAPLSQKEIKNRSKRWLIPTKQYLPMLVFSWMIFQPMTAAFHTTKIAHPLVHLHRPRVISLSRVIRQLPGIHNKKSKVHYQPPSTSSLSCTTMNIANTVRASGVLLGSSLIGCVAERRSPNTGIVTTMVVAACCSNLSLVPSQHVLYDLCWSTFLPASLAFLLLATDDNNNNNNNNSNSSHQSGKTSANNDKHSTSLSTRAAIKTMSVPFFLASIGSILGCVLSFLVCQMFPQLWLSPKEAAIAASCLCASFIGGTVNFFATANVILAGSHNINNSLMSSMAGADLLVMAIYFACMAVALRSRFLSLIFLKDNKDSALPKKHQQVINSQDNISLGENATEAKETTFVQMLQAAGCVSVLGFLIVKASSIIEIAMAPILPGTACAIIAGLAPLVQRNLLNTNSSFSREMQKSAPLLSELCLQLLFASIGVSAKIGEALVRGPACLCFSLFALTVHVFLALAGSVFIQRWFRFPLLLEDVLVASNAAIGGPATAAAFAGRIDTSRQRGLTMAGTVWGVVGYAVGTTIGVALYKLLYTAATA